MSFFEFALGLLTGGVILLLVQQWLANQPPKPRRKTPDELHDEWARNREFWRGADEGQGGRK